MRPLLEVIVENGSMHRHDAVPATIEKVRLTEKRKSICHETNGKFIAQKRVHWASSYLSQAGCLERHKRGYMSPGKNTKAFLELNKPNKLADVKSINE